jgi:hypothetical protein
VESNPAMAQLRTQTRFSIAIFMWTLLVLLYICMMSQWFTISRRDKLFAQYIDHAIQIAANEHDSVKEVRALLLLKAADLLLPIQADGIDVRGSGKTLRAIVHYKADISMPIINQPAYRMSFEHDLTSKPLQ